MGPNHSLYTPPERVPVLTEAGASHYRAEIGRLVHKNRWVCGRGMEGVLA